MARTKHFSSNSNSQSSKSKVSTPASSGGGASSGPSRIGTAFNDRKNAAIRKIPVIKKTSVQKQEKVKGGEEKVDLNKGKVVEKAVLNNGGISCDVVSKQAETGASKNLNTKEKVKSGDKVSEDLIEFKSFNETGGGKASQDVAEEEQATGSLRYGTGSNNFSIKANLGSETVWNPKSENNKPQYHYSYGPDAVGAQEKNSAAEDVIPTSQKSQTKDLTSVRNELETVARNFQLLGRQLDSKNDPSNFLTTLKNAASEGSELGFIYKTMMEFIQVYEGEILGLNSELKLAKDLLQHETEVKNELLNRLVTVNSNLVETQALTENLKWQLELQAEEGKSHAEYNNNDCTLLGDSFINEMLSSYGRVTPGSNTKASAVKSCTAKKSLNSPQSIALNNIASHANNGRDTLIVVPQPKEICDSATEMSKIEKIFVSATTQVTESEFVKNIEVQTDLPFDTCVKKEKKEIADFGNNPEIIEVLPKFCDVGLNTSFDYVSDSEANDQTNIKTAPIIRSPIKKLSDFFKPKKANTTDSQTCSKSKTEIGINTIDSSILPKPVQAQLKFLENWFNDIVIKLKIRPELVKPGRPDDYEMKWAKLRKLLLKYGDLPKIVEDLNRVHQIDAGKMRKLQERINELQEDLKKLEKMLYGNHSSPSVSGSAVTENRVKKGLSERR